MRVALSSYFTPEESLVLLGKYGFDIVFMSEVPGLRFFSMEVILSNDPNKTFDELYNEYTVFVKAEISRANREKVAETLNASMEQKEPVPIDNQAARAKVAETKHTAICALKNLLTCLNSTHSSDDRAFANLTNAFESARCHYAHHVKTADKLLNGGKYAAKNRERELEEAKKWQEIRNIIDNKMQI